MTVCAARRAGPCSDSVFLRDCSNCDITVACKQFRVRDCTNCRIWLYAKTAPVIEASTHMAFAPFNGAYAELADQFAAASFDPARSAWSEVHDFHKGDESVPEPHWYLMRAWKAPWGGGSGRAGASPEASFLTSVRPLVPASQPNPRPPRRGGCPRRAMRLVSTPSRAPRPRQALRRRWRRARPLAVLTAPVWGRRRLQWT